MKPIHSILHSIAEPVEKVKNGYDYIIRGEEKPRTLIDQCQEAIAEEKRKAEAEAVLKKAAEETEKKKGFFSRLFGL